MGLPRPPRADRHPSEDDDERSGEGETQQALFDRVLLDRVEAVDGVAGALFSQSSPASPAAPSPPPPAPLAAKAVRAAAAHAWAGYVSHAWGEDELAPVSRGGYETFCSLAVSIVDSLDTLLLLGMEQEFRRARAWLLQNLPERLRGPCAVSVFEATIRVVGGLASAADLSGDGGAAANSSFSSSSSSSSSSSLPPPCSSLGDLAALAAEALLPAFTVAAAPGSARPLLPASEVDLAAGAPLAADAAAFGPAGASGTALLAEAGSLAPEFWRAGYWRAASAPGGEEGGERGAGGGGAGSGPAGARARALAAAGASAVDAILLANPSAEAPLPPTTLLLRDASAAWLERHTVGGRADSYYEYLLKMWLMLRRAAEAEGDEGAEEAAAAAAAAGERSTPSSASSLASGFVRDRQAELEALSYISSSSSSRVSPEKEEEEEEKEHHHGRNHHNNNNRERSPQTPTAPPMPLARRAEIYRRAWLAAVDEILSNLVRESPGGSRYLTSDMGVRCCFLCFFFFFSREREREGERKDSNFNGKENFSGARHGAPLLLLPRKPRPGRHVRRRIRQRQQEGQRSRPRRQRRRR